MRTEEEVNRAIEKYADTVKRICVLHLKNSSDTEDIFQEVFLKYALSSVRFENADHEKAWLVRVAVNQCRDLIRKHKRSNEVSMEYIDDVCAGQSGPQREVLEAVLSLPDKYKNTIYLHYYEGYSAQEIGKMLGKKINTVYTLLARGREKLEEKLGGEENG